MKTLSLSGVEARFGKVRALRGVDLELKSGEVLMLAGPNGAGKSTLLDILLGLSKPRSGSISVDGSATSVDNRFKARIGYLPEAVAFAGNLTARGVLGFFARARGAPKARIAATLAQVGLADAARRRVAGFSRGMRQRLGIAVAILAEPELLILDEPTGGLDQEGLTVLFKILEVWRAEGRMVLMASHDLALFEHRVDRVCLLEAGRVVAVDTPDRLRERAALPVEARFVLSDHADAFVAAVGAWGKATSSERSGAQFVVKVPPDALLGLLDCRQAHPGAVVSARFVEPGLDRIYDHLLAEAAQ